jgi:hypothetical protein
MYMERFVSNRQLAKKSNIVFMHSINVEASNAILHRCRWWTLVSAKQKNADFYKEIFEIILIMLTNLW